MPNPNDGVIAAESNVLLNTGGAVTGPVTLSGSPPLVIPASAGSGKVATSDADGNLSWGTAASLGTLSLTGGDLGGSASVPTVTATHLASPLPVDQGGTNATTAADALTSLGAAAAADVAALAGATFTGAVTVPSLSGGGSAPVVAGVTHCVASAPAGHDLGGSFVLTTDSTSVTAGTIATVTFGNTYGAAPVAVLVSMTDTTSTVTNVTTVVATVTQTAITIKNTAAMTASHTFLVTYVTILG